MITKYSILFSCVCGLQCHALYIVAYVAVAAVAAVVADWMSLRGILIVSMKLTIPSGDVAWFLYEQNHVGAD